MRNPKARFIAKAAALVVLALLALPTSAMERAFGWSRILATGAPAPGATVTVRNAGTATLSTIFSDNLSTPKANPFTADSSGYWFFYSANGRYDIAFSGGGIVTPYTLSDFVILDSTAVGSICGVSGAGIQFLVGSTGTDFNLNCNDGTDTITYNIPSASATNRGLVTTGAQTFAGAKTFSTPIAAGSGGTGVNGAAAANGRLLIGNGTGFTLAGLTAGAFGGVTITNGVGSITLDTVQDIKTTANPTFADLTLTNLTFSGFAPGILVTDGAGGVTALELSNGELAVGVSGSAPSNTPLGAGPGISVSAGAGTLTIGNAYSLNGLAASSFPTQTFAVGSSGSDFGISSVAGVHTFSLPDAGVSARGLMTTSTQAFAGVKWFTDTVEATEIDGGPPASGADQIGTGLSLVPGAGTGAGTPGGVGIFVTRSVGAGTGGQATTLFENWQGGTAADPGTDETTLISQHTAKWIRGVKEELLTLSTVGVNTDTTNNLLPANSVIEAVTTRVITTISGGGVTTYTVADTATATRFCSAQGNLTSGSTAVCLNHQQGGVATNAAGPVQIGAAKIRITADATPTAGSLRLVVFYRRFVAGS